MDDDIENTIDDTDSDNLDDNTYDEKENDSKSFDYILKICRDTKSQSISKSEYAYFRSLINTYSDCFSDYYLEDYNKDENDVDIRLYYNLNTSRLKLFYRFSQILSYFIINNSKNEYNCIFCYYPERGNFAIYDICFCFIPNSIDKPDFYDIEAGIATIFAFHKLTGQYLKMMTQSRLSSIVYDDWTQEVFNNQKLLWTNYSATQKIAFLPFYSIIDHGSVGNHYIMNYAISKNFMTFNETNEYKMDFLISLQNKLRSKKFKTPELIYQLDNWTCHVYIDVLKDSNDYETLGFVFRYVRNNALQK